MPIRGRCPHCGARLQARLRDVFASSWDGVWAGIDRLFTRFFGGHGL